MRKVLLKMLPPGCISSSLVLRPLLAKFSPFSGQPFTSPSVQGWPRPGHPQYIHFHSKRYSDAPASLSLMTALLCTYFKTDFLHNVREL